MYSRCCGNRVNNAHITYRFFVFLLLLLAPVSTLAQKQSELPQHTIKLEKKKWTFQATLDAISKQTNLSFIADGQPLIPEIEFEFQGTLKEGLDNFTDLFDYTWHWNTKAVLLRKRFSKKDDFPQTNHAEVLHALLQQRKLLTSLVPASVFEKEGNDHLRSLLSMLSDDQRRALEGGTVLRYQQLPPQQQAILMNYALSFSYQNIYKSVEDAIHFWQNLPVSYLQVLEVKEAVANRSDILIEGWRFFLIPPARKGRLVFPVELRSNTNMTRIDTPRKVDK